MLWTELHPVRWCSVRSEGGGVESYRGDWSAGRGTDFAESAVEVLGPRPHLCHVEASVAKKRYRLTTDQKRRKIRVLAPYGSVPSPTASITIDSPRFGLFW